MGSRLTIFPKLANFVTASAVAAGVFSMATYAVAADHLDIERHAPNGDDHLIFRTHPGKAEMAWEIVKDGALVYLNYSRFPWGQDPVPWGMDPAYACYDHVHGKNYVGIGDSLPHLKRAMEAAIKNDNEKTNCMVCGLYETSDSWSGGLVLPDLRNGVPLRVCPIDAPVS